MAQIYPPVRQMTSADILFSESAGLILKHKGVSYQPQTTVKGDLCLFETGAYLIALTINRRLEAISLDIFTGQEQHPVDGIFLQGNGLTEVVGNWRRLPLPSLVDRLLHLFV